MVYRGHAAFMKKYHLLKTGLAFWLLPAYILCVSGPVYSQTSLVPTTIDTTALYDSILAELKLLGIGVKSKKSFFDVNAGVGNGTFSLLNQSVVVQTDHLFYNSGVGYYHKSGLALTSGFNFTNEQGRMILFQSYISPGYDYSSKNISFGVSGFHYFNRENLSFYVSPLVNELFGYVVYKKWWLQPKFSVSYGWGKYDELSALRLVDTLRYPRLARLVRELSKQQRYANIQDVATIFTLRHDFIANGGKKNNNWWRYTPSLTFLLGTAVYGTNTPLNSLNSPRLSTLSATQLFRNLYEDAFKPPPARFALQTFNFSHYLSYNFGRYYAHAQLSLSYFFPKEQSGWNAFYNVGMGITL
jgi:hypothetical protein